MEVIIVVDLGHFFIFVLTNIFFDCLVFSPIFVSGFIFNLIFKIDNILKVLLKRAFVRCLVF